MAIEFSLLEKNRIANDLFGGADIVVKAYSNTISNTGTGGTEITADGYEPIEITNNTTNFPLATTGSRVNAVAFFTDFLTEEAEINSFGVFNADGDFLARNVLDDPLTIPAGEKITN